VVPRHILVVDDEEEDCLNLQKLLEANPEYAVDVCNDGEKALELLIERYYSLVITDLRMPRLDGMALILEVMNRRLPVTRPCSRKNDITPARKSVTQARSASDGIEASRRWRSGLV